MVKYVVTYDNGSPYREWASTPQNTPEEAWAEAGGLQPGVHDARLEEVAGAVARNISP